MDGRRAPSRPVALVTGASYGIGAAAAVKLAKDGFDLTLTELDADALGETAAQVSQAGGEAIALALDLRDEAAVAPVFDKMLAAFGRLDALVNNAGVPLMKPAVEVTYAEFAEVMAINVAGSYFMAQHAARHFTAARSPGAIVNLASTFSVIGAAGVSAYGTSKAAIAGMTRHLAIEWAPYGIRVNAVAPGAVETRRRKIMLDADPALREQARARIPFGRFGEADEMAAAIAYLAGPSSSYVTGQVLLVDGGLTAG